jgi:isocitrate dehydrogenase kinase/phosphatase
MTPLNLCLGTAGDAQRQHAVREYGDVIRDLAAANIFPGGVLFKNFGVTHRERMVFNDYDELCYLTECNFRTIPEAPFPEMELSGETSYSVGPDDIFPEEFGTFLLTDPRIRGAFMAHHA